MKSQNLLTVLIIAALILGALVGEIFLFDRTLSQDALEQKVDGWRLAGQFIFIRPLTLIIIPLIFTSVLTGITSIGDPKKLGLLGSATIVFYVVTMVLAVTVGVTIGAVVEPGAGISEELRLGSAAAGEQATQGVEPAGDAAQGIGAAWLGILEQLIPTNFFEAAANATALSIIAATILLGVGIVAVGEKAKPLVEVVEALHEVLMTIVRWLLWLMPIGVFFLVAWAVGKAGLSTLFETLGFYVFAVFLGLGIHMFITLPVLLTLLAKINPFKFMWAMRPALLMALGTASSMATLPVTIETASDKGGCSRRATGLVLPLGATVNMDGTALYQGIAVIFLFQAFGYDLSIVEYLIIVLTATLSAVGAAGVPGGSLATILIIITAVNTTLAKTPGIEPLPLSAIGLILGVDRILDMCRTMVNVWGDSVGTRIISRLAPDSAEEREKAFG